MEIANIHAHKVISDIQIRWNNTDLYWYCNYEIQKLILFRF
jgi:hypothetical protein